MTSFVTAEGRLAILLIFGAAITACGGSGGGSTEPVDGAWQIPVAEVVDAGPGRDSKAAIDRPIMAAASNIDDIRPVELVIGVMHEGAIHAYSHNILNWHEVVNDTINFNDFALSYCPLTGSAVAWDVDDSLSTTEFGVSSLLFNSNLILYDSETGSNWSQMLEQAVQGTRSLEQPQRIQVVETTWRTWLNMYPDSLVLTRDTSFNRDYDAYPYFVEYRFSEELLFPVSNTDNRLHPKERVIGIRNATSAKVYQIAGFGPTTLAVNDQFDGQPVVAVGNSDDDIAVIFSRELPDSTILTFTGLDGQLPNIMEDTEGNVWDVFGNAVSGPRAGERLTMTNSYTAMWFAWAAFFPQTDIHFN